MGENRVKIKFLAKSENESFARMAVASLIAQLDPTVQELSDIKTAVSEAVTNAIIHGYDNDESKYVDLEVYLVDNNVEIVVQDRGKGIENVEIAREPLYTSRPDLERSGLGFTVMESFMDDIIIESTANIGTKILMKKSISKVE